MLLMAIFKPESEYVQYVRYVDVSIEMQCAVPGCRESGVFHGSLPLPDPVYIDDTRCSDGWVTGGSEALHSRLWR